MISLKHKLEDGRVVDIVSISKKSPTKWFLDYINIIVAEDTFLLHTRKMTLKQEEEWKKNTIKSVKAGKEIYLAAIYGKRVVGSCSATKNAGRESDNVVIGIAISKDFRREGLGEFLMRKTIAEAKKKLKPKNIYLHVAKPNKPAKKLYEKVGFREMAIFPKWMKYKGKYHDVIWMILK